MKRAKRCADWWQLSTKGRMYVDARGQCKRTTAHPSGYCKAHRWGYRWSDEQEAAYQATLHRGGRR
jgi:hypothetical protein